MPPSTPKQASRRRVRLDRLLDPALLRALAEPTRAKLLSCLLKCGRPCSVTEVAACCSVDFSTVSRHLATMARAGLLTADKQGRTVWYSADGESLAAHFRESVVVGILRRNKSREESRAEAKTRHVEEHALRFEVRVLL